MEGKQLSIVLNLSFTVDSLNMSYPRQIRNFAPGQLLLLSGALNLYSDDFTLLQSKAFFNPNVLKAFHWHRILDNLLFSF